MKITIYSLDGCSSCESLRSELKQSSLIFTDIKCNGDVSICDKMESITKCEKYPIVKLESKNEYTVYICLADEWNQIGRRFINDNDIIFYTHSINNMLDAIKKM